MGIWTGNLIENKKEGPERIIIASDTDPLYISPRTPRFRPHSNLGRTRQNSDLATTSQLGLFRPHDMVLQDLGRRINAAVSDLTRSSNLDEKVGTITPSNARCVTNTRFRHLMA